MNTDHRARSSSKSRKARTPNRRRRLNLEFLEDRLVLSTFTVTSTDDAGPGTLREAIALAAGNSEPDTIDFDPLLAGQTIALTTDSANTAFGPTALTIVDDDVTIDGGAAALLKISGSDARRIFAVGSTGSLTLANIELQSGRAQGGNGGDTTGEARIATGGGGAGLGGAIYVFGGTLTVRNATLLNNTAQGGNGGDAGTVGGLNGATGGGSAGGDGGAFDNTGNGGGGGGGVGGPGSINSGATGGAGGANEFGVAAAANADGVSGGGGGGGSTNNVKGGDGASLSSGGLGGGGGGGFSTFDMLTSTYGQGGGNGGFGAGGGGGSDGNGGAGGFGGGGGGSVNGAGGAGGYGAGAGGDSTGANGPSGGGGAGLGGAIFINGGTATIENSTFAGNSARGGEGGLNGTGQAGTGLGGAIFSYNSNVTVNSTTISGNVADAGGGILNLGDGMASTVVLNNSILGRADASADGFVGDSMNGGASTTSGVGNLIRSAVGFGGSVVSGADPLLDVISGNGGPTRTMLPAATSPVLSAGDFAANSLTTDQRGFSRVFGDTIDIGAVQATQPSAPTITTPDHATFMVGSAGTFTFIATGLPAATFTHTGALPTGVTFTDNGDGTATLAGTPDVGQDGSFAIVVTAANGTAPDAVQDFTLTVNPALAIAPTALKQAAVGSVYSQQLTASGGSGAGYVFSTLDALPDGITLSPGGLFSGTPTSTTGSPFTIDVRVNDGQDETHVQSYTLVVNAAIAIAPTALKQAAVGSVYSQQLTASGGSGAGYVFSTLDALPDGITLSPGGLFSGTPTSTTGSPFTIDVTVTDDQGASHTQAYTITTNAAIEITPATLTPAHTDVAYSEQLSATGGSGGYVFSTTDALPDGITLSPAGLLSGTAATTAGSPFSIHVTVTDDQGASITQLYSLTVQGPISISPASLPQAALGSVYSQQLIAAGGSGAGFVFSTTSTLPPGLTLSPSGLISGTPTDRSSSPYTVDVDLTDGDGNTTSREYSIAVNDAIELDPVTFPVATAGNAFSYQFGATGGSGSGYVFTTSSPLPAGLTLDPSGLLSGTITDDTGTPFFLDVKVTDGEGASIVSEGHQLDVFPAVAITPAVLPIATIGNAYHQQLEASGGSGSGYAFSTTDALPPGLTLDPSGLLSGSPTGNADSPYTLHVTATDSNGGTGVIAYSLTVHSAIVVSPTALSDGYVGVGYSRQLTAGGGAEEGYTFAVDALPPGLTLTTDGLLSGAPIGNEGSPYHFTVTVTDAVGAKGSRAYTLVVGQSGTTTGLWTSQSPSAPGQSVTFSVMVTSGGPSDQTPTGTVTFMDGEQVLQADVALAGGVAYFTTSSLSPGAHAITAVYSGDPVYRTSTSMVLAQSVAVQSATTFTASSQSTSYGQPVTFVFSVAPEGSLVATGPVNFFDGDQWIGTRSLDEDGSASLTTADLAVGTHNIAARYVGDAIFTAADSEPIATLVGKNTSMSGAVVTSSPNVFYGQKLSLTAYFAAESVGSPMTGTVAFYDGDTYLGTSTLTPYSSPTAALTVGSGMAAQTTSAIYGQAVLPNVNLPVGDHAIRAVYSGDDNYAPAASYSSASVAVAPAQTRTTLTANTMPDGTTALTASVVATTPGDPPIDGTVAFYDGATLLGTATVNAGTATLNIGTLPMGTHLFSAAYTGSGTSSSSTASLVLDSSGPRVVGLSRYGFHYSPTTLVLNFNSALDPASAQAVSNYQITNSGGARVAVSRAVYDPATWTVTLYPSQRLNLHWTYTLVVNGKTPDGLTGASGIPLDGSGHDQPGTDFTTSVTWRALAVPGGSPAVVYNDGAPQGATARFNAYVNDVVQRTRHAAARVVRPPARVAAPRTAAPRVAPTPRVVAAPRTAMNRLAALVWRPSR